MPHNNLPPPTPTPPPTGARIYTVPEVAALLRVSPATVLRMVAAGDLKKLALKRLVRIAADEVEAFLASDFQGGPRP